MSIHASKCGNEWHLRYPGLDEKEAQSIADRINAGAFYDAAKVEELQRENEALKAHNARLVELTDSFPEINPSNYGDEEVSRINQWGIDLVLYVESIQQLYTIPQSDKE